ncbi:hypothetical protein [uncultured Albimonas sp.]|uniref:hypothetical protein n=1 Tax=uncultured Albimonas sp. TaxID=1331701 RepID=UPI0030EEF843|tara:strand:- start:4124 stop:4327 length:204 start_codon:yes stop_codon:yes gene_type:complete
MTYSIPSPNPRDDPADPVRSALNRSTGRPMTWLRNGQGLLQLASETGDLMGDPLTEAEALALRVGAP